jgi:hypothetical protein
MPGVRHVLQFGGAICAASGFAASSWTLADCHDATAPHASDPAASTAAAAWTAERLSALAAWLREQGADIDAISIKQSDTVRLQ